MNPSNSWSKGSCMRIPLFAALVYAYFCAPISLEHKAFVQSVTTPAPHKALADGYDRPRDPEQDLLSAEGEANKSNKNIFIVVGGESCTWYHILDDFFHEDRKSTRLNSSHRCISYAVFCLKKKKNIEE